MGDPRIPARDLARTYGCWGANLAENARLHCGVCHINRGLEEERLIPDFNPTI